MGTLLFKDDPIKAHRVTESSCQNYQTSEGLREVDVQVQNLAAYHSCGKSRLHYPTVSPTAALSRDRPRSCPRISRQNDRKLRRFRQHITVRQALQKTFESPSSDRLNIKSCPTRQHPRHYSLLQ